MRIIWCRQMTSIGEAGICNITDRCQTWQFDLSAAAVSVILSCQSYIKSDISSNAVSVCIKAVCTQSATADRVRAALSVWESTEVTDWRNFR